MKLLMIPYLAQEAFLKRMRTIIRTVPLLLYAAIGVLSQPVIAQTKVVIIPMAGDDIMPAPFAPVAPDNPDASNYLNGYSDILFGTPQTSFDKTTGLMWQRTGSVSRMDWDTAHQYCADLVITYTTFFGSDNLTDWRLPSVVELQTIVDLGESNPAINEATFPDAKSVNYWSSSSYANDGLRAWYVGFKYGSVSTVDKTNSWHVRCVR